MISVSLSDTLMMVGKESASGSSIHNKKLTAYRYFVCCNKPKLEKEEDAKQLQCRNLPMTDTSIHQCIKCLVIR